MRFASVLASVVLAWSSIGASSALAQASELDAPLERAVLLPDAPTEPAAEDAPSEALPPPPAFADPTLPEGYARSRWESAPGGPTGILDPVLVTHADRDLLMAGGVVLSISYTIASALTTVFGTAFGCSWWSSASCDPAVGALGVLPVVHFAAGFSNTSGSVAAFITGAVFAPIEIIGLILLIAGDAHHHPALVSGESRRAGALELASF